MKESKQKLFEALANYVDVLTKGTRYANDRPIFLDHLAGAAAMFSAIHRNDNATLQDIIETEIRYHGHCPIAPPVGEAVGAAWHEFAVIARDDPR